MASEQVMVTFPVGLRDRAHAHGLNVSRVAANAVLLSVQSLEKETEVPAAKQSSPATTPIKEGDQVVSS